MRHFPSSSDRRSPLASAKLFRARRLSLASLALILGIVVSSLGLAPTAKAAPPQILSTSLSGVTTTTATVKGSVNPSGKLTKYRFEYLTDAAYQANPESSRFTGAARAPIPDGKAPATVSGSADLLSGSEKITEVKATAGAFGPGQTIAGPGIPEPTTILAVNGTTLTLDHAATATTPAAPLTATGPQPVSTQISGLTPKTTYHLRLSASNADSATDVLGPERTLTTFALLTPGLPDIRAYEQASPVDKNGGDVTGTVPTVKSASTGAAITYISTSGFPGGVGAQELPTYLSSRDPLGWSTQGLLAPPALGQRVQVIGWLPDFSVFYEQATRFGSPNEGALIARPADGGPITEVAPYAPTARYVLAGATADGSEVFFESRSKLATAPGTLEGIQGASNLYAWDRQSGELHLLSADNLGQSLPKGAFAGPYDWVGGTNSSTLTAGGSARQYYLQDMHAVAADGSTYFTAAGTGQLYRRTNPTASQSATDGQGNCTESGKACTIHVSASEKTNGGGTDGTDAAGTSPAAFRAASADGSKAFFTSAEKLTDDATTGPEPSPPMIGRANVSDGLGIDEDFLPATAGGIAVHNSFIYWADPVHGTIGRAELNGAGDPTGRKEDFIVPGLVEVEAGVEVPSKPQYVAVDDEHVYWTDATDGKDEHGTIGRADIDGSVEPEFISGASNPQGIAVNASTVYWANSGKPGFTRIGCAEIGGGKVDQECIKEKAPNFVPQGLMLDANHLYWTLVFKYAPDLNITYDYLKRADLDGKNLISRELGENLEVRGIALDSGHVYWVEQRTGRIGRANLELEEVQENFLEPQGTLKGLAADSEHLYFSANGEVQNPGNDLYRYDAGKPAGQRLTDLGVDVSDTNGAEVKGVLGASTDGSDVYFAANGVPDGLTGSPNPHGENASAGTCAGEVGSGGECNLYRWHEDGSPRGEITFIARLATTGVKTENDLTNWIATPTGTPVSTARIPGRTAWVSADGQTLLLRSQRRLTDYENDSLAELYLYRVGKGITCVSCNPTGVPPTSSVSIASINPTALIPEEPAALASRNLNPAGNRVFFETTDALSPQDTNGDAGCPLVGSGSQTFPSCQDVYQWEAPGTGTCTEATPEFSAADAGCLYLLSTGQSNYASFFADASTSGDDAFIFTRSRLVGQDKDALLDVYDVRVDGGLASQNPVELPPCEGEGCKNASPAPPGFQSPASATHRGPGNRPPPRRCRKGKVRRGGRCVRRRGPRHKQLNPQPSHHSIRHHPEEKR